MILIYPIPTAQLGRHVDVPGTFTLKTLDAVEVALTPRRVYDTSFELVPAQALAPHTTYELTGNWLFGTATITKTLRFTTGASPLAGPPAPPSAVLEHYRLTIDKPSSCDPPPTGTCVSFGDAEALVEVAHIDSFGTLSDPDLSRGRTITNLSGLEQQTSFECVQLRARAMNGSYSAPQTLCRNDGPLVEVSDLVCTAEGLTHTASSSCTATRAAHFSHARGAWALCVGLVALLYVRRRAAAHR